MSISRKRLKAAVELFKKEVTVPVSADKTGGPTWKLVQAAAQAVPAAITSPLESINQMYASKFTPDREKIPGYFKTMKAQWSVVKIEPVKKYILEHDTGGTKSRQTGLKGLVTSAATQKAEKNRVALCKEFITQYNSLNNAMKGLMKPNDFEDLEGM